MTAEPEILVAAFNGVSVEVHSTADWLTRHLRRRIGHLLTDSPPRQPPVLRVMLEELAPEWIEVRDSTGRCERGSLEYAAYHARKWLTGAFVSAQPHLLWLHAAAAGLGDDAMLLCGPAGAGKSTLLVNLIARGWSLLADDAVGIVPERQHALPLAFNPEVRPPSPRGEDDRAAFLEQRKAFVAVEPARVSRRSAAASMVVFPEYTTSVDRPELGRLTGLEAVQQLAAHSLQAGPDKAPTLRHIVALVEHVRCYRLRYQQASLAADDLTAEWKMARSLAELEPTPVDVVTPVGDAPRGVSR